MNKFLSLSFTTIIIASLFLQSISEARTLRLPQGRIGTGYKTEKYKPLTKTNMTPTELKRVSELIKQQEEVKKQIVKEYNEKVAQEKELKRQQLKKENEQKKLELAKQKQELAEQKKLEQQRLTEQKQAELQKAKEEQQKLAEQKKAEQAKIEAQKQAEASSKAIANDKLKQENDEKEFEKIANKKFDRVKNLLSFKKNIEPKEENNNNDISQDATQKTSETEPTVETKITAAPNPNQDPQTRAIVKEISTELANERNQMLEELSTLWVSAVQKSDTVYFAIMKLSNPNGEEVNKKGVKKILEPILSAAPLVGQAFVNPALTAGSLIGSNVMGAMMNDSATRRLTKVNDADLVILARAIDELQENLLINYMTYKNALKEYELSIKITSERKKVYDKLNKENSPQVILANTFYTEALDNQYKARQDFLMKRVVLEQMVGSEALTEIENKEISEKNKE